MSSSPPPVPSSERAEAKRSGCKNNSGKTVLAGLLGGVATAAAYAVYQRLTDEQRERLHGQVRSMLVAKWNELRDGLAF